MIKVTALHKKFGDLEVLKGLDVEISKGEVVVVIGPSGSGKSTFLRCLNLLEDPSSGDIIFEGTNIIGDFSEIIPNKPESSLVWDISRLKTEGIISVTSTLDVIKSKWANMRLYPNPVPAEETDFERFPPLFRLSTAIDAR